MGLGRRGGLKILWMDGWEEIGWEGWGLVRVISLRKMGALWAVICLHRVGWDRMELMEKGDAGGG